VATVRDGFVEKDDFLIDQSTGQGRKKAFQLILGLPRRFLNRSLLANIGKRRKIDPLFFRR
jgi:hypothetical protein